MARPDSWTAMAAWGGLAATALACRPAEHLPARTTTCSSDITDIQNHDALLQTVEIIIASLEAYIKVAQNGTHLDVPSDQLTRNMLVRVSIKEFWADIMDAVSIEKSIPSTDWYGVLTKQCPSALAQAITVRALNQLNDALLVGEWYQPVSVSLGLNDGASQHERVGQHQCQTQNEHY